MTVGICLKKSSGHGQAGRSRLTTQAATPHGDEDVVDPSRACEFEWLANIYAMVDLRPSMVHVLLSVDSEEPRATHQHSMCRSALASAAAFTTRELRDL